MKKRRIVKALCLLMAGVMAVSLAGCKKKTSQGGASEIKANAKDAIFRLEKTLDMKLGSGNVCVNETGFLYFSGISGTFRFITGDKEGNLQPERTYTLSSEDTYISSYQTSYSDDGTIYFIDNVTNYDTGENQNTLVHLAADGSEIAKSELKEDESPYEVAALNDGVAVRFESQVVIYDGQFNEKKRLSNSNASLNWNTMIAHGNELLIFAVNESDYSGSVFKPNIETGTIGDPIKYPTRTGMITDGNGYDFYIASNGNGLHGVDLASNSITEVINYMDSDIDGSAYPSCKMLDKETALIYTDGSMGEQYVALYKKVPPSEVKDKEILTLGCFYLSSDAKKKIISFNQTNPDYKIKVIDYGEYNTPDTDYKGGQNLFNTDLTTGNIPDIMFTNNMSNVQGYMNKKLFTDLTPLMEKAGLNKSDYLENVLEAGSQNGKLYILMPNFIISGYMVKNSNLNGKTGLSVDDYMELEKKYDNAGKSIWYCSRDMIIKETLRYNSTDYLDISTGKCNFDSEDFRKILTLANEFPEDDRSVLDQRYGDVDYLSSGVTNRLLISSISMSSFREMYRLEQSMFGEDSTIIGFPNLEGDSAPVIYPILSVAISDKCTKKEGAFEFIKTLISPESQKVVDNGMAGTPGFPILKSALNDMVETSKEPYAVKNTDGTWEPVPADQDTYQRGGKTYQYETITQERIDYYLGIITTTTKLDYSEDQILNMINEEVAPFFAGQKSAGEVTKIIQSRVEIYVKENRR